MAEENKLWLVVETDAVEEESVDVEGRRSGPDTGGGFGPSRAIEAVKKIGQRQRVPLDAKILKSQMNGMLAIVNDLFDQATTETGLQLNEVELSVEIDAQSQVSLVGTGGKLGNTGGITLKFVRPEVKSS